MSKKERLEDLGRLAERLKEISNHDLFSVIDNFGGGRSKDFPDHFETLTEEKKDDFIHSVVYGIRDVENLLYECLEIAEGDE